MPELKEVFDMVTKQTEPDIDSWRDQEPRPADALCDQPVPDGTGLRPCRSPGGP